MAAAAATEVFEIDSKGICLLCLKDCSADQDSLASSSSLKHLLRFLRINIFNSAHFSSSLLALIDNVEGVEVMVTCCEQCDWLQNEFCKKFQELERARMALDRFVEAIHDMMISGQGEEQRVLEYQKRMAPNNNNNNKPMDLIIASVAESLRKETIRKCAERMKNSIPRVSVKKPEVKKEEGIKCFRAPLPPVNKPTSLDEFPSSDEEEEQDHQFADLIKTEEQDGVDNIDEEEDEELPPQPPSPSPTPPPKPVTPPPPPTQVIKRDEKEVVIQKKQLLAVHPISKEERERSSSPEPLPIRIVSTTSIRQAVPPQPPVIFIGNRGNLVMLKEGVVTNNKSSNNSTGTGGFLQNEEESGFEPEVDDDIGQEDTSKWAVDPLLITSPTSNSSSVDELSLLSISSDIEMSVCSISPGGGETTTSPQRNKSVMKSRRTSSSSEIAAAAEGGGKTCSCQHCGMEFASAKRLQGHLHIHSVKIQKNMTVREKLVQLQATTPSQLAVPPLLPVSTISRKPGQGGGKCHICGKFIHCIYSLRRHYKTHTSERPFKCTHCGKTSREWFNHRKHLIAMHAMQVFSKYLPPGTTEETMNGALQSIITGFRKNPNDKRRFYGCPYCPKGLPCQSDLRCHLLQHHFEKVVGSVRNHPGPSKSSATSRVPTALPVVLPPSTTITLVDNRQSTGSGGAEESGGGGVPETTMSYETIDMFLLNDELEREREQQQHLMEMEVEQGDADVTVEVDTKPVVNPYSIFDDSD